MSRLGSFLPYGVDAINCLFTEATPTRATLLANLRTGWPTEQAPALLEELLALGLIIPAVSDRTRFRLASDMLPVDEVKLGVLPIVPPTAIVDADPRFSFFRGGIKSVKPSADITPAALYADLTSGRLRLSTEQLRAAGRGAPNYSSLKNGLDYVTPGGVFSQRNERGLVKRSGLMVLDFDKLPDVSSARDALLTDPLLGPAVVLLFRSPSGDGLKCLLPTDPTATHLNNFKGISSYLIHKYTALGLVPDESGSDISRACFLAHDPDAYLTKHCQNPNKLAAV